MKLHYIILTAVLGTLLVGCESRHDLAQQKMNEIRANEPTPPKPIPVFEAVPSFMYDAQSLRSPFMPTSVANEIRIMAGRRVYPNENRVKFELENYPLETLLMKGTMNGASGIQALIQTPQPDSKVVAIGHGYYLGQNHGRVVRITPKEIDLVEIVPDGRGGYVERPRTLQLLKAVSETPTR